jgi:hypothetical protein
MRANTYLDGCRLAEGGVVVASRADEGFTGPGAVLEFTLADSQNFAVLGASLRLYKQTRSDRDSPLPRCLFSLQ